MEKPYGKREEYTDKYPEYAAMLEILKKHNSAWSAKRLSMAAAKLAVLAAALAAGILFMMNIRVQSTLDEIGQTDAVIDVRVIAERTEDQQKKISYVLRRVSDGAVIDASDLDGSVDELTFSGLTPNTTYEIIYYAEDSDGTMKAVGRFRFTTLNELGQMGDGSGPRGGSGGEGDDGDDEEEEPPLVPIVPLEIVETLTIDTEQLSGG